MINGLFLAIGQLGDPKFRRVLLLSLAITAVAMTVLGMLASHALTLIPVTGYAWLDNVIALLGNAGLVVLTLILFPPVASAVISLFLDDIAEAVERRHYPVDPPGQALSLRGALSYGAGFAILVLAVNIVALPVYVTAFILAGTGALIYWGVNGYLFGREYFELVALRQVDAETGRRLRKANGVKLFLAGLAIAFGFSVPLLNLLVPLIATAWMVHIFKALKMKAEIVS